MKELFDFITPEDQVGATFVCPHCKEPIAIVEKPIYPTDPMHEFLSHVDTIWKGTDPVDQCPICYKNIYGLGDVCIMSPNWQKCEEPN